MSAGLETNFFSCVIPDQCLVHVIRTRILFAMLIYIFVSGVDFLLSYVGNSSSFILDEISVETSKVARSGRNLFSNIVHCQAFDEVILSSDYVKSEFIG